MKTILTILTVNYNSSDFIKISLYAISKLTKYPYIIYILDNGSKLSDYEKLKSICRKHDNVFLERKETNLRGSIGHGTALNYLVKKVKTPYFSIVDADAIWLKKNWDEILINRLDNKIKVIGTEAAGNKPKDFPLLYAILFETKTFEKLNVDFRPKDLAKLQDTGWELRQRYLKKNYQGGVINLKSTRAYQNGPFKQVICAEFYLQGTNHIFAAHFGRGSTIGINKYLAGRKKCLYKIPFLAKILLKNKGKKEKEKWIRICKQIVNRQINERN